MRREQFTKTAETVAVLQPAEQEVLNLTKFAEDLRQGFRMMMYLRRNLLEDIINLWLMQRKQEDMHKVSGKDLVKE